VDVGDRQSETLHTNRQLLRLFVGQRVPAVLHPPPLHRGELDIDVVEGLPDVGEDLHDREERLGDADLCTTRVGDQVVQADDETVIGHRRRHGVPTPERIVDLQGTNGVSHGHDLVLGHAGLRADDDLLERLLTQGDELGIGEVVAVMHQTEAPARRALVRNQIGDLAGVVVDSVHLPAQGMEEGAVDHTDRKSLDRPARLDDDSPRRHTGVEDTRRHRHDVDIEVRFAHHEGEQVAVGFGKRGLSIDRGGSGNRI